MEYAGNERITGILLAAGSSQRFGGDKQSAILDGMTLLERAARVLLDAGFAMPIVVLGPASGPRTAEHRALLSGLPLRLVENPEAASGMASSLVVAVNAAQGADALDAAGECDAIVVTVCDQPAVTARHLRALVAHWRDTGSTIVASGYAGTRGVPVLFAATHFAELRTLRGDRGAGLLLARHSVAVVPLPEGALDIDTSEDLTRLANSSPRNHALHTLSPMRDEPLAVTVAPGQHEGVTILKLNGPLTLGNIFAFQEQLTQHKPQVLIVDLTQSQFMDSAGLGLLMNAYVSAEKNGRKLLLAGANERINAMLETTKVNLILKNYPTAADAEARAFSL